MTPERLAEIEDRYRRSGAAAGWPVESGCRCADAKHENALHDLASSDVPDLLAEVKRLRAERDAVLKIHRSVEDQPIQRGDMYTRWCNEDAHTWPCVTARALGVDGDPS
jgi:outer membrane murein-binding lipoprotein Lpp